MVDQSKLHQQAYLDQMKLSMDSQKMHLENKLNTFEILLNAIVHVKTAQTDAEMKKQVAMATRAAKAGVAQ